MADHQREIRSVIDHWLRCRAERWQNAISATPPRTEDLRDMPSAPGSITLLELIEEVHQRGGGCPVEMPTAEELLSSLAPHPKLLLEVVTLIMDSYAESCLRPWQPLLGHRVKTVRVVPRVVLGQDGQHTAQVFERGGALPGRGIWSWRVNPNAEEGHNYISMYAAQVACDEWLLSQGYYLVEPITTYGSAR